ncbi:MAG TPA: diguanylate cyclase [Roseateles sp.]
MPLAHLYAEDPPAPVRGSTADPMPRLDSMAMFGMSVARHFAQCRRSNGQLALLWMELDVAAQAGSALSDTERESLLLVASQRLRNRVRGSDEVAQVGEHAFTVLLLAAGSLEADLVEERLHQAMRGTYGVDDRVMQVGVRIGRAVFPQDGRNGADLAAAARRQVG